MIREPSHWTIFIVLKFKDVTEVKNMQKQRNQAEKCESTNAAGVENGI